MIRRTFVAENEVEAAAIEHALTMVRELQHLADATPDGQVLAVVEQAAVEQGRRFTRDRLQDVLNTQAADLEEKRGRGWDCPCGGSRRHQGPARRRLLTAAGEVTLHRVYFRCRRGGLYAHALDERLGVTGFVSPHAQRLLCLAGVEQSFEKAARRLRDLAGLVVCDNTVRAICDRHGTTARAWQREDPVASRGFRTATGEVEFQTDGTCVNTTKGWREIRLSLFAKRARGRPVLDLNDWEEQRLPAPTARVATAVIRTSTALGPQWRRAAARLGIARTDQITVLADGAKWIWKEVAGALPGAEGVLDFYHAGEHIYAAAHGLHGQGTTLARAWAERLKRVLLESGAVGVLAALGPEPAGVGELITYLEPHRDHTASRERLREGRSIGSGMVEGGCRTAIGLRLKQTGARWKVRRVEHMAALCCLCYGEQWDSYWKSAVG